jgi:hypothetical protein
MITAWRQTLKQRQVSELWYLTLNLFLDNLSWWEITNPCWFQFSGCMNIISSEICTYFRTSVFIAKIFDNLLILQRKWYWDLKAMHHIVCLLWRLHLLCENWPYLKQMVTTP